MDELIIVTLILVIINGAFDAIVVAWLAGRRSQRALERWIDRAASGDKEAQETLSKLMMYIFNWVGSAQIKTGKKVKVASEELDEKGEPVMTEVEEVLTPIEMLSRVIATYVMKKTAGSMGTVKAQMGKMLKEEAASFGGGSLSPFALQQLTKGKLGPALGELAMSFMSKGNKNTTNNIGGGLNGEGGING